MIEWRELRIAVVGPIPPPAGGMAMQAEILVTALRQEGATVELIPVNPPMRPAIVARIPIVRALFRLIRYVFALWRACAQADLVHLLANSGWSWYLYAVPAIRIAGWRHRPVVINYRGGQAREFFQRSWSRLQHDFRRASAVCVPSKFLQDVFSQYGIQAAIVPNILAPEFDDADARASHPDQQVTTLIVTRNLEAIYDIGTAIRAFALIQAQRRGVRLVIAGEGPERDNLRAIARQCGVQDRIEFTGRLDRLAITKLYRTAALLLNPSLADNNPNSLIEALAAGVPVVSTNVGGIPTLIAHERNGLLVNPGDAQAMAHAALAILEDPELRSRLIEQGSASVERFRWPRVRVALAELYGVVLRSNARVTLKELLNKSPI